MKKIFNSRALALILVLAMAVSLLTLSVSAATTESLSGHGSNISSIVVTGADFESVDYTTSTDVHGTVYDYYLAVPTGTANGTALTATFTAADGQPTGFVISSRGDNVPNPPFGQVFIRQGASNTYTAALTDGARLQRRMSTRTLTMSSASATPTGSTTIRRCQSASLPAIPYSSHGAAIPVP